jgi:hypothetical protein
MCLLRATKASVVGGRLARMAGFVESRPIAFRVQRKPFRHQRIVEKAEVGLALKVAEKKEPEGF